MKDFILSAFRIMPLMLVLILLSASRSGCEEIKSISPHLGINDNILLAEDQSEISVNVSINQYTAEQQDPEETLTKKERRQLRKEARAERRAEERANRMAAIRVIDNPRNADYILLGEDLPRGSTVLDAISGRVPGLTSSGGNVMVHGPSSFYGGMTPLFLVDEIEVNRDYANSLSMEDIERIEIFTGPSAAIYGSRVGNAVISIFTKYSTNSRSEE